MNDHETEKKFKCDTCGKLFHLKWRLNKHEENHRETNVKHCHYFTNKEPCTYDAIGCKFQHVPSKVCRMDDCQDLLCPFIHKNVINDEEDSGVMEEETQEELNENQCHLCRMQLLTKDYVYKHVQVNHEEYFNGMMEVAARMSNPNI